MMHKSWTNTRRRQTRPDDAPRSRIANDSLKHVPPGSLRLFACGSPLLGANLQSSCRTKPLPGGAPSLGTKLKHNNLCSPDEHDIRLLLRLDIRAWHQYQLCLLLINTRLQTPSTRRNSI